jgi:hypothetical protein
MDEEGDSRKSPSANRGRIRVKFMIAPTAEEETDTNAT